MIRAAELAAACPATFHALLVQAISHGQSPSPFGQSHAPFPVPYAYAAAAALAPPPSQAAPPPPAQLPALMGLDYPRYSSLRDSAGCKLTLCVRSYSLLADLCDRKLSSGDLRCLSK